MRVAGFGCCLTLLNMLVELSVMEQRYQAVLAVIGDGVEVTEAASRFGVSRQTLHRWLARYERAGLAGLADRSHVPRGCPHQMDPAVEVLVLEMRRAHPGWGPRRLLYELGRGGPVAIAFEWSAPSSPTFSILRESRSCKHLNKI
jgi:transposase